MTITSSLRFLYILCRSGPLCAAAAATAAVLRLALMSKHDRLVRGAHDGNFNDGVILCLLSRAFSTRIFMCNLLPSLLLHTISFYDLPKENSIHYNAFKGKFKVVSIFSKNRFNDK